MTTPAISCAGSPVAVSRRASSAWACILLLGFHAILAVDAMRREVVTVDEGGHLIAGIVYWHHGAFQVYHVNPPFLKLLAALPVVVSEPKGNDLPDPSFGQRWLYLHDQFMVANASDYQAYLFRARLMIVVLSCIGGWVLFLWSRELFGAGAGLCAVALWAFCPNMLAFAGLVTMDLGAAVFALVAMYVFWRYTRMPGLGRALAAGLVLGYALLTKYTLLVLCPIWLVLWIVGPLRVNWHRRKADLLLDPCVMCVVSLLTINVGYGFKDTCLDLGEFSFMSPTLTGRPIDYDKNESPNQGEIPVNRFRGTWLHGLPVPVPAEYLLGLDEQKSHSDYGYPAYLAGEWRSRGWWYYYLYGLAIKTPLGTFVLTGLAAWLAWKQRSFRLGWYDELTIWLPALVSFGLVSSQTGINSHFRYVLPALPFLFLGISRTGILLEDWWNTRGADKSTSGSVKGLGALASVILMSLGWNVVSVLRTHPHELSYFNEIVGGPDNGWKHLIDSNIDWGQDLLYLKQWLDEHPEAQPLGLAHFGLMDPSLLGIKYRLPPQGSGEELTSDGPLGSANAVGPQPGWYAVSVNFLCGMQFGTYDADGQWRSLPAGAYCYFQDFQPVAKAGYSIFIYHVTEEEANSARQKLGLPPLAHQENARP